MSVYRDRVVITVLIVGVCCFSLLPAMYLVFRAWQWHDALQIMELVFFPLFVIFAMAAWLAYRRNQARRMALEYDEATGAPGSDDDANPFE